MDIVSSVPVAESRVREHFDASTHLYVNRQLAVYKESVEQRMEMLRSSAGFKRESKVSVLDVGCGAGMFLDMYLENFPNGTATGIDLSPEMLKLNMPSDRKKVFVGDALNLPHDLGEFDAICIDTVMHHLISSEGYPETMQRIQSFLSSLQRFLVPGGVVMVREIYHEYFGFQGFGSRAIYSISTLRVPSFVEMCIKRAGIQTANAGVCFLTRAQWQRMFEQTGFQVAEAVDHRWPGQPYRKFGFRASGDVHYLLRRKRPLI